MAYGEKYWFQFNDLKDNLWRVSIQKNNYVGSATNIKASGNPVNIKWRGNDLMTALRTSECTLNLISDTNFYYSDFFTALETDFIVEIKKDGVVFWNGCYVPENYSEPYNDTPYDVTLKFNDGLAYLKKIEFTPADSVTYGKDELIDIIFNALGKLPAPLAKNLREVINIFELQMPDTTKGTLYNLVLDTVCYIGIDSLTKITRGISWYKILDNIIQALGCTMYQWNNYWYIWRIDESSNNSVTYYEYDSTGAFSTTGTLNLNLTITNKDTGNPNEIIWIGQSAELNITSKYSEIITQYNMDVLGKHKNQLLPLFVDTYRNAGDDTSWRTRSRYWSESAQLSSITTGVFHQGDAILGRYYLIMFDSLLSQTKTLNQNLSMYGLQTPASTKTFKNLIVNTTDKLKLRLITIAYVYLNSNIQFEYTAFNLPDYTVIYPIKLKIGNYYLNIKNDNTLEWTLTETIAKFELHFIEQLFEIILPAFPVAGVFDMDFRIYITVMPVVGTPGNDNITQRQNIMYWELWYIPAIEGIINQAQSTNTLDATNDEKLIVKFAHSDPIGRSDTWGFLIKTSYAATTNWYYDEEPSIYYNHNTAFHLLPLSKLMGRYRNIISGNMYSDIINFYNVFNETGKSYDRSKRYFLKSLDYNLKTNNHKVEIEEIGGTIINSIIDITEMLDTDTAFDTGHIIAESGTTDTTNTTAASFTITTAPVKLSRIEETAGQTNDYNNYP